MYIRCTLCLRQRQFSFSFLFHGRLHEWIYINAQFLSSKRRRPGLLCWIFTIKNDENDLLGELKSNPSPSLRNISLESMTVAKGSCCLQFHDLKHLNKRKRFFFFPSRFCTALSAKWRKVNFSNVFCNEVLRGCPKLKSRFINSKIRSVLILISREKNL